MMDKKIDRIAWNVLNRLYGFLIIGKIHFIELFKNNNYNFHN